MSQIYIGSLTEIVVKWDGLFVVCIPGVLLHVCSSQKNTSNVCQCTIFSMSCF